MFCRLFPPRPQEKSVDHLCATGVTIIYSSDPWSRDRLFGEELPDCPELGGVWLTIFDM
jgi:hypothetical protein